MHQKNKIDTNIKRKNIVLKERFKIHLVIIFVSWYFIIVFLEDLHEAKYLRSSSDWMSLLVTKI